MADSFSFELKGADELLIKLKRVSDETKLKGGWSALRKAAQLVAIAAADQWRQIDDKETGRSIADNIALPGVSAKGNSTLKFKGVRKNNRLFKATGDLGFRVGVQGTARPEPREEGADGKLKPVDKSKGAPTPHWRLLEFGTSKIPANGIMRGALTNNIGKATDTFMQEYDKVLDRAIKKAAKGK